MTDEALEAIEIRIAFLERANQELSDVVFRQRQEIDALQTRLGTLTARLDTVASQDERPYTLEEEKPPHY